MIVSPHILGQVEVQAFPPNAALGGKLPLQVSLEPFQPVDMGPSPGVLSLTMVHQTVDVAISCYACISSPTVGVDG